MSTAALYIRVSTTEQANKGYSLQAQKELLTNYCVENGIEIYKVYADEGKSANKALSKRTALLEMLSDAEQAKFDLICFKDITRWSRSSSQYYTVQDRLDKAKVSWIAVDQPYLETRTPTGRFTVSIMLGTAQLESENTGQRIRFVYDSMARSKIVPFASQSAPFGYKVEIRDNVRRLIKDGSIPMDDLFKHLLEYRNESRTRRYMLDKYGIRISSPYMTRIVHNPIYTGVYNGIPDFTEPYLTERQFNEIQNLKYKRFPERKYSDEYIFKGILKCSICGRTMQASLKHFKKQDRIYYRCQAHYIDRTCSMSQHARQDVIEKEVLQLIKPEFDKLRYKVKVNKRSASDRSQQINRLETKLKRLTEVYIDGSIDRETYNSRKTAIQDEIQKISQTKDADMSEIEKFLNSPWETLYHNLTNEEKGRFFRTLFEQIKFDGKNIIGIDFKIS